MHTARVLAKQKTRIAELITHRQRGMWSFESIFLSTQVRKLSFYLTLVSSPLKKLLAEWLCYIYRFYIGLTCWGGSGHKNHTGQNKRMADNWTISGLIRTNQNTRLENSHPHRVGEDPIRRHRQNAYILLFNEKSQSRLWSEDCTEEFHQDREMQVKGQSWDETRGGGGGLSGRGGWSGEEESTKLEELPTNLGSRHFPPFNDKEVPFLISDGDCEEWTSTASATDSSSTTINSMFASSPAVATSTIVAELTSVSFVFFLGPEENPSSLISWFSFLHLNQTWEEW